MDDKNVKCEDHFHFHVDEDESTISSLSKEPTAQSALGSQIQVVEHHDEEKEKLDHPPEQCLDMTDRGCRRIVRNFTPSWFMIVMSTGVLSICLHQLPYNGRWLHIISTILFVLNIVLFVLFLCISILRYVLYPHLVKVVINHPHQSLFLATFPVGLATIINMIVLVCAPIWGQGWAILAWVLWWFASVLALSTCFHLAFMVMSNRRSELEEMSALYLIPIVAVVIAASSGGLVAGALKDSQNQLWTLLVSYVYWGIGAPLSWIVLTMYFIRLTIHKPLKREIIVSLLIPLGPLSLAGFSLVVLGKAAKHTFALRKALPHIQHTDPGEIFYVVGVFAALIFWGFSLVWLGVAVAMITRARPFPFSMGWWGFVFPSGIFTLLTIVIGQELESKFFKILSCVLAVMVTILWLIVVAGTIRDSISGKMFYAPCLATDLYARKRKTIFSRRRNVEEGVQKSSSVTP